jgi:epoxyqueuosine reductase QueG
MIAKDDLAQTIEQAIREFASEHSPRTDWRKPLAGYAAAKDPLFEEARQRIGSTYELPTTLLPDACTVIAYFIPFSEAAAVQEKPGELSFSSDAWAYAYIETNDLLVQIGLSVADLLKKSGYDGIALPPTHHFDTERLVSDWSHKHAGFIAGLGTWGLHRMVITESGCCGRFGSVVTNAFFEPTPRPTQERCLYLDRGGCGACVRRCQTGALTHEAFDRHRCYAECLRNESHHADKGWADVCGQCAIFVPCSFRSPAAGKS